MTKIITNFPDYTISTEGVVTKLANQRKLSAWVGANGYKHVDLRKDGKGVKIALHRLLAITFLENPENKRTVNHIDGDKLNNCLTNLEWATDSENTQHAYTTGLQPYRRKFTEEEYYVLLEDFLAGETLTSISERVGHSLSQLSIYLRELVANYGLTEIYEAQLVAQKRERAAATGIMRRNKITLQMLDKDTEVVLKVFNSVAEAREFLKRKSSGPISNVLAGRQNTAYGYKWKKV